MRLRDNTVLITGGATGIGRGLAVALHELGNRVVIAGRRAEALRAVTAAHPGIEYLQLDQSDVGSLRDFVVQTRTRYPELNVLINNAATMALEDLTHPDPDVALQVVTTNLLGPIALTALLVPLLTAQPTGAIVNVTSALAFVPMASAPTYSATKAGLHSFTRSLRFQLRHSRIRVIELAPPRVHTDMRGPSGSDAMSLDDFVVEAMAGLAAEPPRDEIVVGTARVLRDAERQGEYAAQFAAVNPDV